MTRHLSTELIESYSERNLSRAELAEVNEHLYGCEICYEQFLNTLQIKRGFPVEIDLDELAGLKDWHLQGEDLKAYAEGTMSKLDLDYANLHLQHCAWCKEEVDNFSEFEGRLEYYLSKSHAPLNQPASRNGYHPGFRYISKHPWRVAAAAALLLLILGSATILWSGLRIKSREKEVNLVESSKKEDQLLTQKPSDSPPPPSNLSDTEPKSAGAPSSKHKRSTPLGSENKRKPTSDRQETESVLIARDLVMPPVIEIFDRSPVVLRGNGDQGESFNVMSPYGTVITDDRPTFRWTDLRGATSYTVSVYDANLNLAITSEPLTETEWRMPKPLERGVIYTWVVTAIKEGKEILAPPLPARAEFKIIESSTLVKLNRRIERTSSNAARGMLYAEAGLLDEAEKQFRIHLGLNPDDERVKKLIHTIKSWRNPQSHIPPSPTTTKPPQ